MHKVSSIYVYYNKSSSVQNRCGTATVGHNKYSSVGMVRSWQEYVPGLLLTRWGMKLLGLTLDTKIYGQKIPTK